MISNYYASTILDLICGVTDSLSLPDKLYLGLSASAPAPLTGAIPTSNGEPIATSYERTVVGGISGAKKFGTASSGIISNSEEIQFKTARDEWGTMNYFFLSQSKDGPAIMWGEIWNKDGTQGVTIGAETVAVFYEGDLRASLDVPLN
ncbi:MAG: hypothetical protein IJD10_05330 [Clostridia bacterium]|nr:hypothetical protein [Clostridia bacterium]